MQFSSSTLLIDILHFSTKVDVSGDAEETYYPVLHEEAAQGRKSSVRLWHLRKRTFKSRE